MTPKVINVKLVPGYKLELLFSTGEKKLFSAEPYLNYPVYKELKGNWSMAKPFLCNGTVCFGNDAMVDFDPDILYIESETIA